MSLEKLIALEKKRGYILVKAWWPKPTIKPIPERLWGDKWRNVNSRCMHKFKCYSFSSIGFHTSERQKEGLPGNLCMAYGETPQGAYDRWCEIFNVWNKKEEWL